MGGKWIDLEKIELVADNLRHVLRLAEERGGKRAMDLFRKVEVSMLKSGRGVNSPVEMLEKLKALESRLPDIMRVTGTAGIADITKALEGYSAADKVEVWNALKASGAIDEFGAAILDDLLRVLEGNVMKSGRPKKYLNRGDRGNVLDAIDSVKQWQVSLRAFWNTHLGITSHLNPLWDQLRTAAKRTDTAGVREQRRIAAEIGVWEARRDNSWNTILSNAASINPRNVVEARGVVVAKQHLGRPLSPLDIERARNEYWTLRSPAPPAKATAPPPPSPTIPAASKFRFAPKSGVVRPASAPVGPEIAPPQGVAPRLPTRGDLEAAGRVPPERRIMIQRGMNGPVTVVFPDADHKILFDALSKRAHERHETGPLIGMVAGRFGLTSEEARELSEHYRIGIIGAVKPLEEGAVYVAPIAPMMHPRPVRVADPQGKQFFIANMRSNWSELTEAEKQAISHTLAGQALTKGEMKSVSLPAVNFIVKYMKDHGISFGDVTGIETIAPRRVRAVELDY